MNGANDGQDHTEQYMPDVTSYGTIVSFLQVAVLPCVTPFLCFAWCVPLGLGYPCVINFLCSAQLE